MVWFSLSSGNKGGGGVAAAVGLVRTVVIATMGCFFGCFGIKNSHSQSVAPPDSGVSCHKNALSSLFASDDDSLRNGEGGEKSQPEELEVKELKNQAKFLMACGTLAETPLEIRKASERWVGVTSQNGEHKYLNVLPNFNASIDKLKLDKKKPVESPPPVKIYEESVAGTGSDMDSPSSCMTDGNNIHRADLQNVTTPKKAHSNTTNCFETSPVSPGVFAPSVQCNNRSVHFDCDSDRSPYFSKGTESVVSKPSPYPTPLKLTDEMQTPGTVFPAYLDNMDLGKTTRIRSQYVCPVFNPVESLHQWNELKDGHLDSSHFLESHKLNDEAALMTTSMVDVAIKDLLVKEEIKDEAGLASWFKPLSAMQDDDKKRFSSSSGENARYGKTPGDRPILGMVAAHWNDDETSHISPKWWDGNGIPNSTNKYKEDQKVNWHATPFEERLEKALSEETFISKRKPITGTPPVDFNEAEESDTALSNLQPSTHFNSVFSF